MFRKRRQPTPHYRLPPPYEPMTGEHAELMEHGVYPYCAMMQVAEADTHQDYVVCRGFDVRTAQFRSDISVAKPFWNRRVNAYRIGEIFPAFLPLQTTNPSPVSVPWRVGQNPGVSATTQGQPADLNETVGFLYDDAGILIAWMLLDSGGDTSLVELCLAENHPGQGIAFDAYLGEWDPATDDWEYDTCSTTVKAIDHRYGVPYPDAGATGLFTPRQSVTYVTIYECVSLDCTSEKPCCT